MLVFFFISHRYLPSSSTWGAPALQVWASGPHGEADPTVHESGPTPPWDAPLSALPPTAPATCESYGRWNKSCTAFNEPAEPLYPPFNIGALVMCRAMMWQLRHVVQDFGHWET